MYLLKSVRAFNYMKRSYIGLQKYTTNAARNLSFSSSYKSELPTEIKKTNTSAPWNRIYFFPYIVWARLLNRFKLYQTFITVSGIPISIYMYNIGLAELSTVELVSGCAVVATGTLFLLTSYFRRLIGIIYISDDEKFVKISHLTFWGSKNDLVVPIEDIIPLAECDSQPADIYVKLHRYSTEEILYFTLTYGRIVDKIKFEKVFGGLDTLG